jgi:putative transposase
VARDAQCTEIVAALKGMFPEAWLNEAARSSGWMQRLRKVSAPAMFWTLVLGFGCGRDRTISSLRRGLEQQLGLTLEESSFYDRFTPGLVKFLRMAVARGIEHVKSGVEAADRVRAGLFKDIVNIDSTVLRLHSALATRMPGTRTNHSPASAKVHLVHSVIGRGPRSVKLTDGRMHDNRVRHLGAWVRDCLLLFDLGYYDFRAFSSIVRNGGYFVSRLKEKANPEVVEVVGGLTTSVVRVGATLADALARTTLDVLDLRCRLQFRRRPWAGRTRGASEVLRVIAIRDPETRRFHVYITNIGAERLAPDEIATVYSGRWAIELLFKELKSQYRIHDLPSSKLHVIEALILAALLTLITSHRMLALLRQRLPSAIARRLRPALWARVFAEQARVLTTLILAPRTLSARQRARWLRVLKHQATDSYVGRNGLDETLLAIHQFA